MAMNSITGPSIQGIQRGVHGLRRVASEIASNQNASQTSKPTDLSRAMVEMQQHAIQARASVNALQSSNDAIGTLFDERA